MTDRPDIWHHLRDHEALPPEEICNRLQRMLGAGDSRSSDVPGTVAGQLMERLQQHEVPPPSYLRSEIVQRSGSGSTSSGKAWRYISAAACLMLLVAGWLVYRNHATSVAGTAANEKKQPSPAVAAGVPVRKDTTLSGTDTSGAAAGVASGAGGKRLRPSFSIGGEVIRVTDNDLLATFAGFTYPDVPGYLTGNTDKPLHIYVDQYTNITVSKNMLEMIKQMYQVLPNGKPARKARRAKRRLESWKERDQKRFDKGGGANPLDPVDLAEFIFK